MTTPIRPRAMIALMWAFLLAGLVGCGQAGGKDDDEMLPVGVRGLNYTDIPVGIFYVEDKWGGAVRSYAGGSSMATSYAIPRKWRPGLKVRIDWRNDLLYHEDKEALTTTIVEIPPYEEGSISYLWVAFLPCDRIRVYVSHTSPGFPGFPDQKLINPRDYCEADARCRAKFIDQRRVVYEEEMDERHAELRAYHEAGCKAIKEGASLL